MIAIVLGSGVGGLIDYVEVSRQINYSSFLDFDIIPLEGHERILYEAHLGDQKILVLSGKLHAYEGYSYDQLIAPLRYVNEHYKVHQWIISSASGGLSNMARVGEWYKVSNILTLDNVSGLEIVNSISTRSKTGLTYAFQRGPSLGTVAEYKMLSIMQSDMVGMSMLPESIFLRSIAANYELYSLPVCSYYPLQESIEEPSHEEVIAIADKAVSKLVTILRSLNNKI